MLNLSFLKQGIRLPFGGGGNGQTAPTATRSSSTTDVSSQAECADPEKARASDFRAVAVLPDGTDKDAKQQTTTKKRWPLWMKLAMAGCLFSIVAGLAIGLGVGLTRHKHSNISSQESSAEPPSGGNGTDPSQKPGQLAVYWGAMGSSAASLDNVCGDASYDTVNLAFLSHFFANGQYPRLAIASLGPASEAQRLAGAVDLQDGAPLAPAIRKCQAAGKRVLLSMGGAAGYAEVRLASDAQGRQVADTIWELFLGGGGGKKAEIRPFGDVVLDGVDFDNESGDSTGYEAMAAQFRTHFASDPGRRYYMTAAPQCPPTTDEAELRLLRRVDAVSVQFYNNNVCNVGASGFEASVRRWSAAIAGGGGSNATLLVGALAGGTDKDEGYVEAGALAEALAKVRAMKLANYGGVMLWEAELAAANGGFQKKIRSAV
ncbi:Glycoside hydrolase, subgroup, catalytic core [Cordyceps fumosorosea ARSEF 2679]|uniref:chitinase n=1 Tax=Cordyceps fumosorosea (strain ARSEF 2679) TaxID=1081104 RepID=A0A168CD82_CORFA|nr:Glycoside hydrolase, subgroup, catalytic core [Cordyceps fumosorosea ARSEF 2679]OAA71247.1 Glycoside hydrolase, subgroup, catalytic core [Cordyceps fumosorosea ARSEF 2679]